MSPKSPYSILQARERRDRRRSIHRTTIEGSTNDGGDFHRSAVARRAHQPAAQRRARAGGPRGSRHRALRRRPRRSDPATGATPTTLAAKGDLDLALLETDSGREETSGIKRLNFDIIRLFVAPMPHQTKALSELLSQKRFDAILADYGFFGVLPFALGDSSARPPVLLYGTTPLMFSSRDTAPTGLGLPPSTSSLGRLRNRALNVSPEGVAAPVAEGRQLSAAPAQLPCAADLPVRFRGAGRPPHRADGARVRLSAHRPARQRPLCRHGASVADGEVPSADVVVEARRRPAGRARHPGHHRQRRLQQAAAADDRGAGRRERDGRRHHRWTGRLGTGLPAASQCLCRRILPHDLLLRRST